MPERGRGGGGASDLGMGGRGPEAGEERGRRGRGRGVGALSWRRHDMAAVRSRRGAPGGGGTGVDGCVRRRPDAGSVYAVLQLLGSNAGWAGRCGNQVGPPCPRPLAHTNGQTAPESASPGVQMVHLCFFLCVIFDDTS